MSKKRVAAVTALTLAVTLLLSALGSGGVAASSNPGVVKVAAGYDGYFALTTDGRLLACGRNDCGQLLNGGAADIKDFTVVATDVADIAAGGLHTLMLKRDGSLWAAGNNSLGQIPASGGMITAPVKIANSAPFFAAGYNNSFITDADGNLTIYGKYSDKLKTAVKYPLSASSGQYFGAIATQDGKVITIPDLGIDTSAAGFVIQVAVGKEHVLLLNDQGDLYAFGYNGEGQVGVPGQMNVVTPVKVLSGVRQIAAGDAFSMALTNDNAVYAWGDNTYGQLGVSGGSQPSPVRVIENVAVINGNSRNASVIANDGTVYTWGSNDRGQLGMTNINSAAAPKQQFSPPETPVQPLLPAQPGLPATPVLSTPKLVADKTLSDWAAAEVNEAVKLGLVPDSLLSNFDKPITRSEFCELIMKLCEKKSLVAPLSAEKKPFTDTNNQKIAQAYALGIVKGIGGGKFEPNSAITRQDMAVMFARAVKAQGMALPAKKAGFSFADDKLIADYAAESVPAMYELGVVKGVDNNKFNPKGDTSREQAIAYVLRTFKL